MQFDFFEKRYLKFISTVDGEKFNATKCDQKDVRVCVSIIIPGFQYTYSFFL